MIPFPQYIRLTLFTAIFLLIVSFVLWCFLPSIRPFTGGYLLGALVGIINGAVLAVKTVKVSDYALDRSRKMQGTGVLQRFLPAGLAGYAAIRFPEYIYWGGVIPGLLTVTIVSLVIAVICCFTKS